jgi:small GTP-binding protein
VLKNSDIIYQFQFGKGLNKEQINQIYSSMLSESEGIENIIIKHYQNYKIGFLPDKGLRATFVLISGHGLKDNELKRYLKKFKDEFLSYFIDIFTSSVDNIDQSRFNIIEPTLYSIYNSIIPKISLMGFDGVGKTTICQLLSNEGSSVENLPSRNSALYTLNIGKLSFSICDFTGKEHTSEIWRNFIEGSEAILLITDSSRDNVDKCKQFKELVIAENPNVRMAIIANKQDLEGSITPGEIGSILELTAYPMVATSSNNRDKMITIISDIIDINTEASPLLKQLSARDKIIQEAHNAIEEGDFKTAAKRFELAASKCEEMEDFQLSKEYKERAQKLLQFIKGFPTQ